MRNFDICSSFWRINIFFLISRYSFHLPILTKNGAIIRLTKFHDTDVKKFDEHDFFRNFTINNDIVQASTFHGKFPEYEISIMDLKGFSLGHFYKVLLKFFSFSD